METSNEGWFHERIREESDLIVQTREEYEIRRLIRRHAERRHPKNERLATRMEALALCELGLNEPLDRKVRFGGGDGPVRIDGGQP